MIVVGKACRRTGAIDHQRTLYREGRELCRLRIAASFLARLKGLLGSSKISHHSGLFLHRCRDIHTFGMKITIDVVMIDTNSRVVFAESVLPNRIVVRLRARHTIELKDGTIDRLSIKIGDELIVSTEPKEKIACAIAGT